MKTYEAVFNEKEVDGVFGISLVNDPAMEGVFVALKKQAEIKFAEVDAEQRILMGLVLEPNKPVYRNQNGEEFNIVFNEKTVKDLSYGFFKSNSHKNSTVEHNQKGKIEGVTFVESWIVQDSEKDKSANFGFNYPKGSWLATMKVDNDDIWDNYVKTGKVKGFSIDAMLSLKEINLKSHKEMTNDDLFTKLSEILGLKKDDKNAEAFKIALSEYSKSVEVKFSEEIEAKINDLTKKLDEQVNEPNLDDIIKEVAKGVDSKIDEVKVEFTNQLDAKNTELLELKKQVVELSEQPAVPKITSHAEVKLTKEGRLLAQIRKN
jgi:hypothetical protein